MADVLGTVNQLITTGAQNAGIIANAVRQIQGQPVTTSAGPVNVTPTNTSSYQNFSLLLLAAAVALAIILIYGEKRRG